MSSVGIGGMLSQESHSIGFFSEKLNEVKSYYYITFRSLLSSVVYI